ncbi:hypothetical protein R70723_03345 [Paenibacillus sp. FSL R7-0273]|uniref:DUF1385 domain-containing protein n=1 Tax=Paenibacillus sp. FSL R7-0273 TaxID=1536772 RepID=UPI0004F67D42|nr:DUF1385 domain-containing protein [Paenibacillus sp. FSL R7-0273]AIQ45046.1 hypothetical protein R70723_03345 [Paenibacillus sp. FSL R7-0273]OMF88640.1 hypothetical protein BK144_20990 [Paenibacillus sp. FSL R7-0273]
MNTLGGRAYRNGVMFVSNHYMVTATLNAEGSIDFEDKILHEFTTDEGSGVYRGMGRKLAGLPFIRGVVELGKRSVDGKVITVMNGVILLFGIFSLFLPSSSTENSTSDGWAWLLFLIALIITAGMIVLLYEIIFGPAGKFHAAEHMAANAYDRGWKLNVPNVQQQSRVHPQCGTNLAVFIVLVMILISPIQIWFIAKIIIGWSVGMEIFMVDHKFFNILLKPFYWLGALAQRWLFTSKPQTEHIEVAIACLKHLEELEKFHTPYT